MGNTFDAEKALLEALRTSRAPPLNEVEVPRYLRELRTIVDPSGSIIMHLDRRGCRSYKNRRTSNYYVPPPADTNGIMEALNHMLAPHYRISAVTDHKNYITIYLEVLK